MTNEFSLEHLREKPTKELFDLLTEKMARYSELLTIGRHTEEFTKLKEVISNLHVVLGERVKAEK